MKLLLDFPTVGEPHYAEAIPASLVAPKSKKFFKIAKKNCEWLPGYLIEGRQRILLDQKRDVDDARDFRNGQSPDSEAIQAV